MRTYLFDLDGTLLDSIDLILASFHHTSRVHLNRELSEEHWLAGVGTPLRDQLALVARSEAERDAMVSTYVEYNLEHHDTMVKPYPGVVEVVQTLRQRGAALALVTSKMSRGAQRGLQLLGLEREFPVRICADDVVRGKPHPEPVYKALAALDASPEGAVLIGDSPHDIEAGRAAGIATAAVSWGPLSRQTLEAAAPDFWIEQPAQLLDL
ncbi:MAG: HAD-IA family hydrolase [Polyangiales bacterium]